MSIRSICFLFLFFPCCVHAQLSGRIDSLGRKQGKFNEKMLFSGYPDSLDCTVRYQDNKRAAGCDCFFKNGAKAVDGFYNNKGQRNEYWIFQNPDGSKNYELAYENDTITGRRYYVYAKNDSSTAKKQLLQVIHKDENDSLVAIDYFENNELVKTYYASNGRTVRKPAGEVNLRGPWAITAGYNYQNTHWLELTVKKFSYNDTEGPFDMGDFFEPENYLLAGAEMSVGKNKKTQLAPKAGAGVYLFHCCNFNLNCILYNDQFQTFYPAITPEIGYSAPYGIIQVDYGYNIFPAQNKFMPHETHRISVRITIPFLDSGY